MSDVSALIHKSVNIKNEKRYRLFVFDHREMLVFFLMLSTVSIFSFTLGVHFGKRISPLAEKVVPPPSEAKTLGTVEDAVPNRQELREQTPGAAAAAEDALTQGLHDEVLRTGISLDHQLGTLLPDQVREIASEAGESPTRDGHVRYSLQVGSHPTEDDANAQIQAIAVYGVKPRLEVADLKKKGKWYRVMIGSYVTQEEAETSASRLKAQNVIDHYVVTQAEK